MQPSEFWALKPRHFWYLFEAEKEAQKKVEGPPKPGALSKHEVRRLKRLIED